MLGILPKTAAPSTWCWKKFSPGTKRCEKTGRFTARPATTLPIRSRSCLSTVRPKQRSRKRFTAFIGHSVHFGHLVYAKKRLVMRLSLANDVNVLGNMLDRLSEQNRWFRDFTLDALARAVRETIACFPVYRTYLAPGRPVNDEDRAVIERAVRRPNGATLESKNRSLIFCATFCSSVFRKTWTRKRAPSTNISFSSSSKAPGRSWRRVSRILRSTFTTGWRR